VTRQIEETDLAADLKQLLRDSLLLGIIHITHDVSLTVIALAHHEWRDVHDRERVPMGGSLFGFHTYKFVAVEDDEFLNLEFVDSVIVVKFSLYNDNR